MLTITIFAAGLVGLAGVLGLRRGRAQAQVATATAGTARATVEPTADERGITLQTLIVTAVLVLMAVAAGVVIVAITNNAAEDLEQQATSIDSNCTQTEIYDPVLASRGERGRAGNQDDDTTDNTESGAVNGSGVGCRPVCIFEDGDAAAASTVGTIESVEIKFARNYRTTLAEDSIEDGAILVFRNPTHLAYQESGTDIEIDPSDFSGDDLENAAEVRVTPAQNACGVYDDTGKLLWQTREDD